MLSDEDRKNEKNANKDFWKEKLIKMKKVILMTASIVKKKKKNGKKNEVQLEFKLEFLKKLMKCPVLR
jgi:hypothetical protein